MTGAAQVQTGMCPFCGRDVPVKNSLTVVHPIPFNNRCPGSEQNARCAESDGRPLWSGKANRRFRG